MSSNIDLMLDVSQAAELKLAFRRNDWNNAEIKTLSEGDILGDVLKVIRGQAEIKVKEHLIDCDANPSIPGSWSVEEHRKIGMFKFNPEKISLYLSKYQEKESVKGNDLRKELASQPTLNANILDYLLDHPGLIPEEWRDKNIFFWGTIYRDSSGGLGVRYLFWYDSKWRQGSYGLVYGFSYFDYAAIVR